jgi:TPR repeat protein
MKHTTTFITITLVAFFVAASFAVAHEWVAMSGHKLTGEFVELNDGNVSIKLPNGKIANVPLDKLSESDREFAEQEAKKKDNPFVIQDDEPALPKLPENMPEYKSQFGKDTSLETLQAAADKNNPDALCWLGIVYGSGLNKCTVDKDKMTECFEKASKLMDNNSASVLFSRGVCAFYGYGVEQNQEVAVKLFRQAAEQNFAPAQEQLGMYLINQLGVTENKTEGVAWIRKAAEQNFAPAQFTLSYCYAAGVSVKKDEKESLKWYQKAADNGDVLAQKSIGTAYLLGLSGLERDIVAAFDWFIKAAKQGDAEAIETVKLFEKMVQYQEEPQAESLKQNEVTGKEGYPESDERANDRAFDNTDGVRAKPNAQKRSRSTTRDRPINPDIPTTIDRGIRIYNTIRGLRDRF